MAKPKTQSRSLRPNSLFPHSTLSLIEIPKCRDADSLDLEAHLNFYLIFKLIPICIVFACGISRIPFLCSQPLATVSMACSNNSYIVLCIYHSGNHIHQQGGEGDQSQFSLRLTNPKGDHPFVFLLKIFRKIFYGCPNFK